MRLIQAGVPDSPARVEEPVRLPVRVGLVQHAWREDPAELEAALADGIALAAQAGAQVVFLPELTLSRYPAFEEPAGVPAETAEDLVASPPSRSPPGRRSGTPSTSTRPSTNGRTSRAAVTGSASTPPCSSHPTGTW